MHRRTSRTSRICISGRALDTDAAGEHCQARAHRDANHGQPLRTGPLGHRLIQYPPNGNLGAVVTQVDGIARQVLPSSITYGFSGSGPSLTELGEQSRRPAPRHPCS